MKGLRTRVSEKLAIRRGGAALQDVDTQDSGAVESVISQQVWSPAQKAFVLAMYKALTAYPPRRYDGRVVVFETGTQPLFHLRQVGAASRVIADALDIAPVHGNRSGLVHERNSEFLATEVVRRFEANNRVSRGLVM